MWPGFKKTANGGGFFWSSFISNFALHEPAGVKFSSLIPLTDQVPLLQSPFRMTNRTQLSTGISVDISIVTLEALSYLEALRQTQIYI